MLQIIIALSMPFFGAKPSINESVKSDSLDEAACVPVGVVVRKNQGSGENSFL